MPAFAITFDADSTCPWDVTADGELVAGFETKAEALERLRRNSSRKPATSRKLWHGKPGGGRDGAGQPDRGSVRDG